MLEMKSECEICNKVLPNSSDAMICSFGCTYCINCAKNLNKICKNCNGELKAEMEAIQQQMVEAKKNERANALKEVKRLCKEFGFTAGMLKDSLAEGRGEK